MKRGPLGRRRCLRWKKRATMWITAATRCWYPWRNSSAQKATDARRQRHYVTNSKPSLAARSSGFWPNRTTPTHSPGPSSSASQPKAGAPVSANSGPAGENPPQKSQKSTSCSSGRNPPTAPPSPPPSAGPATESSTSNSAPPS